MLPPVARSLVGLFSNQAGGGDQALGPAALVGERERMRHHPCAGGGPFNFGPDPDDLPCCLDAEGQGRSAPHIPTAVADELVPVRHPRGLYLDQHLTGPQRRRLRQLKNLHLAPELLDAGGSHADIMAQWRPPSEGEHDDSRLARARFP